MANIIDYVERRGDKPLSRAPLNEVDALVLCALSYMPMDTIVGGDFGAGQPLGEVAGALLDCGACDTKLGIDGSNGRRLLEAIKGSARFGAMRATAFVNLHDERTQEQFSAVTILCGGEAFLAFRGTDGTIVGWKEDFNMSFEREVPAQRSAVRYADEARRALGLPMTLGGHSKGGNLAAYALLFADDETSRHTRLAYNFDGPGFHDGEAIRRAQAQRARVYTFVPQDALVGMLLWHSEPFMVVRSDGKGLFEHDPFTWQVMGGRFVPAKGLTLKSRYADQTIREWLLSLPTVVRRRAIDGMYEVLAASGDERLSQLRDASSLLAMLRKARSLDAKTREAIEEMLLLLGKAAVEAIPRTLHEAAEAREERERGRIAP